MITTSGPAFLPPIVARGHSTTEKEMKMGKHLLEMIVDKMFRSGCGHDVNYTPDDFCPQCRIAELEAVLSGKDHEQAVNMNNLLDRIEELEAKLDRVQGLPEKWRNGVHTPYGEHFATVLQSALGDEE